MRDILRDLRLRRLFFDGATGSVLQGMGLAPGEMPEKWNIDRPEAIVDLHYGYYKAGANIVKTNTFGANTLKFPSGGESCTYSLESVVTRAINNAIEARRRIELEDNEHISIHDSDAGEKVDIIRPMQPHYIALDIGPTGKLLKPLGDLGFEDAIEIFAQTIRIGESLGVDLILIETMNDSYEAKAAVIAAKENSKLPIFVTTVYDDEGKLLTGASPLAMCAMLEGLRVDAYGMNCSLGPEQMKKIVPDLIRYSSLPIIINPNAGLPRSENGETIYDVDPDEFASHMRDICRMGASIIGGCCGTSPRHISKMVDLCTDIEMSAIEDKNISMISSGISGVVLGERPVLVGERINPTGKPKLKAALRDRDMEYILREAITQEEAGAHILDVNVGLPEIDEPYMMEMVVRELQDITSLPLQIDTSDYNAMERALRIYKGKAMINSVNGKREVMDNIFPLVSKYGGLVIALTIDEDGIPEDSRGRLRIATRIYEEARKYGIASKDIIIDPLAMAVSADEKAAIVTLNTVRDISKELGGNTILGVSNISFGLPERELITSTFFAMALECGLSAGIVNPLSTEIMKVYRSYCVLKGHDNQCDEYITFATDYSKNKKKLVNSLELLNTTENTVGISEDDSMHKGGMAEVNANTQGTLEYAITHGLKEASGEIALYLLKSMAPLDIVNEKLIPALDIVGKGFELKKVYLPQLLISAEAAKSAFAVINNAMAGEGEQEKKGSIVVATVKGDIHDIGKNIVKVLLENYGYDVRDLGKDVPVELIVDEVVANDIKLVALSALMTTTVPSMAKTIEELRIYAPYCKVAVGGAVLSQDYADMIGADFYAKDAMGTVSIANNVFGR